MREDEVAARISSLQNQMADQNKEYIKSFHDMKQGYEKEAEHYNELKNDIKNIKLEKEKMEDLANQRLYKNRIKDERIKSLQSQLDKKASEMDRREDDFAATIKQRKSLKKKTNKLESKMKELTEHTMVQLKKELSEMTRQNDLLKDMMRGNEISTRQLQKDKAFLKKKIARLEKITGVRKERQSMAPSRKVEEMLDEP